MDPPLDVVQRALYLGRAEIADLERMIEESKDKGTRRRLTSVLSQVDQRVSFLRDKLPGANGRDDVCT